MATDKVSVEITIEEQQALKALNALSKGVDKFEKNTVSSVKKSDKAFDSFKGNLAAIATSGAIKAIGAGLKDLVLGSLEAAASTEKIRTQLEVLTGSQEKAASLYKELTQYSAGTPFQLQGISEAAAQLVAFGFEANTVKDRIEKIGEVAAGSSSDLKEVALIYGQVAAAGKLTGERLLQFQERAIPIGAALKKVMGDTGKSVKDMVSAGEVDFAKFEEAFNSMSESGGLFEGAVKKQSETLNGVISTLKDNFFLLQSEIGGAFAPDLIVGAKTITSALQDLTKVLVDNKEVLAAGIGFVADYVSVYANLAGQLIKTKGPLDDVNASIEENLNKTQVLISRKEKLEGDKGSFFGLFDAATQQSIDKVNGMLKASDGQLKELIARRKELIAVESAPSESSDESPAVKAKRAENLKILEEQKVFEAQVAALKEEKNIKEQESILAKTELDAEQRIVTLESLQAFNDKKTAIELDAALEKNKKIRDAKSKALADEAANLKASIAQQQNAAKTEAAILKAKQNAIDKQVAGFAKASELAVSISKEGTAEHKALSIASATISTYAAAARAMQDYPYPANIAVAGLTTLAGLKNVKEITNASFATGGVVGGFNGAANGGDNTTANVRTGEMILNASEQRVLFDIATGSKAVNGGGQVIEITSIVQVDEREIARSVRNQRLEGFAV